MKRFFLVFLFTIIGSLLWAQNRPIPVNILDYQKELKLSQNQIEKIKIYLFDLERKEKELRRKLVSVNAEIRKLLNEGAQKPRSLNIKKLKEKIKKAFEIRAEILIARIETANKINRTLTDQQFKKWREIIRKNKLKALK